jgi:hypothetical protein
MAAKGTFLSKGALAHVKGKLHIVTEEIRYRSSTGVLYVVPVGFQTDGGSVPRFLWWLYPPFGDDAEIAYVLHDYVYKHAEELYGSDPGLTLSRREGDGLLLDALEALDYRPTGRPVIHNGVRAGGWNAWRKHRKAAKVQAEINREAGV